jgi:hypothetical protein
MKSVSILTSIATIATLHAGTTEPVTTDAVPNSDWLVPTLDARLRYEYSKVSGFDGANALTMRVRPGLKTADWNGFSAFVEGEFTGAAIDDYNGGAKGAYPNETSKSLIADPQNAELNRATIEYQGYDTTVIAGRQTIIYNNAAFVGDVGWRQNEQTYDGATVSYKTDFGFAASYAWVGRVNRVYGADADGVLASVDSNVHLINASYTGFENVSLGSYAYLMNFENPAVKGWDNNTYGIFADSPFGGVKTHAEVAFQTQAGPLNNIDAFYFHVNVSKTINDFTLKAGIEQLGQGFQTPLATLHAMDGLSDVVDARRAAGTTGGITDNYLSLQAPLPWKIKWTNVIHFFGDNSVGSEFGYGVDSLITKKFNDQLSATAMIGYFDSNDKLYTSAVQTSIQLDYTF